MKEAWVLLVLSVVVVVVSAQGGRQCITSSIGNQLDGFIAWPGSSIYNNSIAIDNGSIHKSPLAVIFPFTAQDVSLVVIGKYVNTANNNNANNQLQKNKIKNLKINNKQ